MLVKYLKRYVLRMLYNFEILKYVQNICIKEYLTKKKIVCEK